MTKSTILQIVGFALLIGAVALAGFLFVRHSQKLLQKIETIENRKAQVINADSIRNIIEKEIVDSVKVILKDQDAKIDALTKVTKQTRRQNEALEKRFNDIVISMPDF
jgi:hypothetical protein